MRVKRAFAAEAEALTRSLRQAPAWERPTRCPPWTVRDEFAHTAIAVARTLNMLRQPPPKAEDPAADPIPAHAYFGRASAARVPEAQAFRPPDLVGWFERTWRDVLRALPPGDRLVTTRWATSCA